MGHSPRFFMQPGYNELLMISFLALAKTVSATTNSNDQSMSQKRDPVSVSDVIIVGAFCGLFVWLFNRHQKQTEASSYPQSLEKKQIAPTRKM